MISEEERNSIVNEAVEKALLKLPEVIGNLIVNQVSAIKLNREFYTKYPEFAKVKNLVAEITTRVEGENLGLDYKEILAKAVPLIREQMRVTSKLDTSSITRPNRKLDDLNLPMSGNGDL